MTQRPSLTRIILILLCLHFSLISAHGATLAPDSAQIVAAASQPADVPYSEGELILKFRPGISAESRTGLWQQYDLDLIATVSELNLYHCRLRHAASLTRLLATLANHPFIAYAQPNYRYHLLSTPNDLAPELWGLNNNGQSAGKVDADIDAPEAWDYTTGSGSVIVAVTDSGIDYTHPDLVANMWVNPGEIPGNGIDDDHNGYIDDIHGYDFIDERSDPMDDYGHGTHVAGTIGAVGNNSRGVVGVNWNVQIMALKFIAQNGWGTTMAAINATLYAANMGARAINNSWGGGEFKDQALQDAVQKAYEKGVVFVVAAGNDSKPNDIKPSYPANFTNPNVISVAASTRTDTLAEFSNWGKKTVHIAAPGKAVYSCYPGNRYTFMDGTSMASPHVVGAIALILSLAPDMSVEAIKDLLFKTTDPLASPNLRQVMSGRLNVHKAVKALPPDTIPPAPVSDLTAESSSPATIKLTWTATGNNGQAGQASRYEIRYSTEPLTTENFLAASLVPTRVPPPQKSGQLESLLVGGLEPDTTYYFALRVMDVVQFSGLSNISQAQTQKAAIIFRDDFENGLNNWMTPTAWGLTTSEFRSASHGLSDSPDNQYIPGTDSSIALKPLDFGNYGSPVLSFYLRADLAEADTLSVEASRSANDDGTSSWSAPLLTISGQKLGFVKYYVDLSDYEGQATVRIRFHLATTYYPGHDGVAIDDVTIMGLPLTPCEVADGDGDGYTVCDGDCDDADVTINPGLKEIPGNNRDDDCNRATADDDYDSDGYAEAYDCDDGNFAINPGQEEISYNGLDDDCQRKTADDDLDGDGYRHDVDCNDQDNDVNPGAREVPANGVDDDCNGQIDYWARKPALP